VNDETDQVNQNQPYLWVNCNVPYFKNTAGEKISSNIGTTVIYIAYTIYKDDHV